MARQQGCTPLVIGRMRYEQIDKELFVRNRKRLAELLEPGAMAIVHANDILPANADGVLPFVQNRDLYYLSGVDQEETVAIIFPDAAEEKDREILFVRETSELHANAAATAASRAASILACPPWLPSSARNPEPQCCEKKKNNNNKKKNWIFPRF